MDRKLQHEKFKNWAKNYNFSLTDLFPTIGKTEICHIDLSKENTIVRTEAEFNNPTYFEGKLAEIQAENNKAIITGGYLEKRSLYTSDIYNAENSEAKRNIHLGVDFWLAAGTAVHAFLDGEIICAVHQKSHKGYGGFVILKHKLDDFIFYTLYGHLSEESLKKYSVGSKLKKGDKIGDLGNYDENGAWVPHLHFQVMLTLLDYKNDFPGVALESEIDFWKEICPNPNYLLKSDVLNNW
ncbi:peptidoglycan DD-metalloendopeptidase family protein [Polaribacter sp. MED152]|uniref:peptidoglycan DD-metalloendopeptidase family protein n=1 Tax=Polaribacter sp. MED152 TaxID=313598 RepID=UPI0000689A2B|nr:peptidoglycan DD-metalloendopeptidase family protein [Polaribacter sp. MED152]EAQ40770.1 peptidase family M23 [Polaribacter sp. MED152]